MVASSSLLLFHHFVLSLSLAMSEIKQVAPEDQDPKEIARELDTQSIASETKAKAATKPKKKKNNKPNEPVPLMEGPLPLHAMKFDGRTKEARRIVYKQREMIYRAMMEKAAENKSLRELEEAASDVVRDGFLDTLDQDVIAYTQMHDQLCKRFREFSMADRNGLKLDVAMAAYLSRQVKVAYDCMMMAIDTRCNLADSRNSRAPQAGPIGDIATQLKNAKPDEV